ncbi:hypothetical protein WJX81_006040 [Elliptochloris bilobata]|uniref:Alpha-ketoglutarate-dependent dioxygenase AlkB-like domain-containing protein n=1 Tax=Elliptochloris bilobata TaxID=381761 RepID=A0AAW1R9V2_9CHLO
MLIKSALPAPQQETLLEGINDTYFFQPGANQAMCFGSLPYWAEELVSMLQQRSLLSAVPARQPLFDQLAVNRYEPGEGLKSQVDLPHRFDDGVVIVSLGAPAVMRFTAPAQQERCPAGSPAICETGSACLSARGPSAPLASVLLDPGDCLILAGIARYGVLHGFDAVKEEWYGGRSIVRGVRTSVTLRKLL